MCSSIYHIFIANNQRAMWMYDGPLCPKILAVPIRSDRLVLESLGKWAGIHKHPNIYNWHNAEGHKLHENGGLNCNLAIPDSVAILSVPHMVLIGLVKMLI